MILINSLGIQSTCTAGTGGDIFGQSVSQINIAVFYSIKGCICLLDWNTGGLLVGL